MSGKIEPRITPAAIARKIHSGRNRSSSDNRWKMAPVWAVGVGWAWVVMGSS